MEKEEIISKLKGIIYEKSPLEVEKRLKEISKETKITLKTLREELELLRKEIERKKLEKLKREKIEFLQKLDNPKIVVDLEDYLKCKHADCLRLLEYWLGHYNSLNNVYWKEKFIEIKQKNIVVKLINTAYDEHPVKRVINTYLDKSDLAQQIWEVQPYFYDRAKMWWLWNDSFYMWECVDEVDILNMVSAHSVANTVNSKERNEILEAMKQFGRLKKPKEAKKTWVQFKDTIIDIKTGETLKATPEYFVTNPIMHEIGESEETPETDRLFEEWVGKDYVKTLQQICAYCMLPDYPIHRLFCLIGEGSNGKTTFLEYVRRLVGVQNITSTELEDLIGTRFEKAKLYRKSVCIMGETNFSTIKKTSLIKKLTGQDVIGAEKKNKDPFDFVNYAKIIISTNGLPYSEDQTDGWFRRWCIINFPNQFEEKVNVLNRIPPEEYNNMCKKAIRLLKELLEEMKFHNEGTIYERREKYNEFSNPVNKFIEEVCKKGVDFSIPFFKFYDSLMEFIKARKYRPLSKVEVSRILKREGYDIKTERRTKFDGTPTSWKVIVGLDIDYGNTKEYQIIKDISSLVLPEQFKNKLIGEKIAYSDEIREEIDILVKEGYLKEL